MNKPNVPWFACKLAFYVHNAEAIWAWDEIASAATDLPTGWSLEDVDHTGSGLIAIFAVEGLPRAEDGEKVVELLQRIQS